MAPDHGSSPSSRLFIGDRYELLECIGTGAHGRVYRAHDTKTREHVAVKEVSLERLRQSDIASIMGEVELLKSLNHRNIVQYLGSFQTRRYLYIIMELVEAGSLASMVRRGTLGPFPEALIGFFVDQILRGLAYLHSMGITHRDIKGANILTNSEGLVKLADFGVAAKLDEERGGGGTLGGGVIEGEDEDGLSGADTGEEKKKEEEEEEDDGDVAGTPYWMAPEVVELQDVTVASDIWSLGCVVIELLTGRPPYFDLQPLSAMYNIVQDPHPPLPAGVSEELEDFLLQCFSKDPLQRPSAKDLTKHAWIVDSRRTMKSVWADSSSEFDADMASVIERLLASELVSSPSKDRRPSSSTLNAEDDRDDDDDGDDDGDDDDGDRVVRGKDGRRGRGAGKTAYVDNDNCNEKGIENEKDNDFRGSMDQPNSDTNETNSAFLQAVDADPTGADALSSLSVTGTLAGAGAGARHAPTEEDAADLNRQVESLRAVATSKERSLVQEAAAAASARAIDGHVRNDPSLAETFYLADGLSSIREILDAQSERLVGPCFDLLLTLADADVRILEHACSLGLVPAAMRFALRNFSLDLRRRAGQLATMLVRGSPHTATMFVACQGIPFVMALMDGDGDDLELTSVAVSVFWTVLRRTMPVPGGGQRQWQQQRPSSWPNQYLRLMVHHDLPAKLADAVVRALDGPGRLGDATTFLDAAINLYSAMCRGDMVVKARCALYRDRLSTVAPRLPTDTQRALEAALSALCE